MKSYFTKKLQESNFNSHANILITGTLKNPSSMLLPYLITHFQEETIIVTNFGENLSNLHYQCKRIGVDINKENNLQFIDMFSSIAREIADEYPLTRESPYTHKSYKTITIGQEESLSNIMDNFISNLEKYSKDQTLILSEIEYFLMQLENELSQFILFIMRIIGLGFKRVIFMGNRDIFTEKNFIPLYNLLISESSYRVTIKDLESGYSKDLSGSIEFEYANNTNQELVSKNLKFAKKMSKIVFFEQFKVN